MVVRLGGAICVAAITFACSSYSVSSNGIEKEITPRPVAGGPGIGGVASSYNPYRKDWTAAIHILYLTDYVYSEVPPDSKTADTIRDSLKDVPVGTPVEEIKRASDAFGLDFNFMKAVAKIESDFDPKQRTGSYVGLFQLSNNEFAKYGSGDILNARDNAVAAAYKFSTAATLFELNTHKKATNSDLYLSINKVRRARRSTSTTPTVSLGNQCVPPMRANRRVKSGVSERSGATHFPKSSTFGKPLIT
jgi:hypothetical protein